MSNHLVSSRPASRDKRNRLETIAADRGGAVLVEAAVAMPLLIVLLLGIVTYSGWFMAAHSLQQAANEAARYAVAGIDAGERKELVAASIERGTLSTGTLNPKLVKVESTESAGYLTVAVSYEIAQANLYKTSLVPLPGKTIRRTSVIQIGEL